MRRGKIFFTFFLFVSVLSPGWCSRPKATLAQDDVSLDGITLQNFDIQQGRIAFSYATGKKADIYVVDFGRLVIEKLVGTPADEDYPVWSPDGQKLLYTSDAGGDREIYVTSADGKGSRRLTNSRGIDEDPDWSPDGTQIIFKTERTGPGSTLFVMNADGSAPRLLGAQRTKNNAAHSFPKWSPRGKEILFTSGEFWPGWDVLVYDMAGKKTNLLTKGVQSFCRASWHPNGGSFILSYGAGDDIDIWSFEKGGEQMLPLVVRPGREYDAIWTDDGEKVIFAGELTQSKGDFQLFVWVKKDNAVLPLLEGEGVMRFPAWTSLPALSTLKAEDSRPIEGDSPAQDASAGGETDAGKDTAKNPPAGGAEKRTPEKPAQIQGQTTGGSAITINP